MGGQGAGRQSSPLGWLWGGFNFGRGRRQAGLCSTHMLAGRDVIRYAEAADAEESHQAAATFRGGVSGGRQRTLSLQFVACRDATSLFISVHDHCPNAYIANPCTTVV